MLLPDWYLLCCWGLLGLLVGSFLNVVIHRLPIMLERDWAQECAHLRGEEPTPLPRFNLAVPRSRCPHCGHGIQWYENIPVLSFLVLRARCSQCHTPISWRYPLVELVTGALFVYCAQHWGINAQCLVWSFFCAALVAMTLIDWDTTLLPDDLTQPLLWMGLIASAMHWTAVPLADALAGAVAGYMSLWLVYWGFKFATGKEGMGYGDFKLFAALGVWFGWQALVPVILISSVIGAMVGLTLKFTSGLRQGGQVPFGPFLAGAGLACLFWGPQRLLQLILP